MSQPPRTRGDCEHGPRPCPWVDCRYHLAIEQATAQAGNGSAPLDTSQSCALDVADLAELAGGLTLEDTGEILGITRERVRQIEAAALVNARRAAMALGIDWDRVLQVRAEDLATTLERWPVEGQEEVEEEEEQERGGEHQAAPKRRKCACGCGKLLPEGTKDRQVYASPQCRVRARAKRDKERSKRLRDAVRALESSAPLLCACGCGRVVGLERRAKGAIYARPSCNSRSIRERRKQDERKRPADR